VEDALPGENISANLGDRGVGSAKGANITIVKKKKEKPDQKATPSCKMKLSKVLQPHLQGCQEKKAPLGRYVKIRVNYLRSAGREGSQRLGKLGPSLTNMREAHSGKEISGLKK